MSLCKYSGGKYFTEVALSYTISEINLFLQFTQKFKLARKEAEKQILGKNPDDSADTMGVKNLSKIALCRTVSEINVFSYFTQKFNMAAKNGGKVSFGKFKMAAKISRKTIFFTPRVSAESIAFPPSWKQCMKCVFTFYAEIQDGRQNGGKAIDSADTLGKKNPKITLSCTVSKLEELLLVEYEIMTPRDL